MTVRNHATFKTSIPDDACEDEAGNVIVPAGRALAAAIAGGISTAGLPWQRSHYGWEFVFRCPSGWKAQAVLQGLEQWLLTVKAKTSWFASRRRREEVRAEAVMTVRASLGGITGLTEIIWLSQDELSRSELSRSRRVDPSTPRPRPFLNPPPPARE